MVLHLCPCVNFPSSSNLIKHVLFEMVQKTMDLHVLPNFAIVTIVFCNFDLWMSKGGVDIFASMITYLDES
jgi:hypothetical protein